MDDLMNKNTGYRMHAMLLATLTSCFVPTVQAQNLCVYDLGGSSGDITALMKDYVLAAKSWGANLTLKTYKNEAQAVNDFKAGQCAALGATSFSTMEFNNYVGTMSAIGAVPSNAIAKNALLLMGNPKLSAEMVQGAYEAVGVIPIGAAYFVVKDRSINTLAKAEGKRVGVLEVDPAQSRMVQKVGAKPVFITFENAVPKLTNNDIDVLPGPAIAFEPLEVYRAMGPKGGIARFPISFMTGNIIIKKDDFPAGYGQKSRTWVTAQVPRYLGLIARYEAAVPRGVWFDISNEDKVGYLRIMRQMRIEFVKNKTYNTKMISLLKKLRCQQDPSSFECALSDE
jgi:hypothetical protein